MPETPDVHKHMNPAMHECIHACEDASDACLHAVHDCLKKGGPHADVHHVGLLLDCAQMARTAHDFLIRHSHLHPITCGACAEVCDEVAASCEKMGDADVATICRKCSEACRKHADEPKTH